LIIENDNKKCVIANRLFRSKTYVYR